jgi:hypothetical protein
MAARAAAPGLPQGEQPIEADDAVLSVPTSPEASAPVPGSGTAASGQTASDPELPAQASADKNVIPTPQQGTVAGVGKALYNPDLPYLFPFEVTSILLLIATIGSVVLAQRKTPAEKSLDAEDLV